MKQLLLILALLSASAAFAEPVYVPNLKANVTGTDLGGGHTGLDISGSISATNPSVGTTGSAVPASAAYIGAKNGSGNLIGLLIGNQTMANSLAVNIASDQGAIPVTGTFWQATQPISAAALPLPTLAATSTIQATQQTSLTSIDGKIPALGQALAAGSVPVVLTAAQLTTLTPATSVAITPAVTGSGSSAGATVSTVITLSAPANAIGFILMNWDTSTANIIWAVGRTATTTLGQQLQPGRDTGFVPIGANVSLVAASGTQTYDIQWIAK